MEITYEQIRNRKKASTSLLQFPLEEEINLEQNLPDVDAVIGQSVMFEKKTFTRGEDKIQLSGECVYQILCETSQGELPITTVKGSLNVSQNIMMKTDPQWELRYRVDPVSVSVKRLNSRKLSIFTLIEVEVVGYEIGEERFAVDIPNMQTTESGKREQEPIQKLYGNLSARQLLTMGHQELSIRHVLHLPSNRADIGRILYQQIQLRSVELQVVDGGIWMTGEACVFLLYVGGEEDGRIEYLELLAPIEGQVDESHMSMTDVCNCQYEILSAAITEAANEDGEIRDLHLAVELDISYQEYGRLETKYLMDAYSLLEKWTPQYMEKEFVEECTSQQLRIKLGDAFLVPREERILNVYPVSAKLVISETKVRERQVIIEGTCEVTMCYLGTMKPALPQMATMEIPFHQEVDSLECEKDCMYEVEIKGEIAQLTANIVDASQAEAKVVVNLNIMLCKVSKVKVIQEMDVEPYSREKRPGMVGYIIHKGDSLWEMAKENRTTVEAIRQVNECEQEPKEGTYILVCQSQEC